jgi:pimeloyl-ACP methyl ester carboxylesterase
MDNRQSTHKYVLTGRHRLAYLDEGSGPPVLLIHGIPTSSLLWRQVIPVLAQTHRVIAPDMLNYRKSDKPVDADVSIAAQSRLMLALHDWMGDAANYDAMIPLLDPTAYMYVFADLRGYGRSRYVSGDFSAAEVAAVFLAALIAITAAHGSAMTGPSQTAQCSPRRRRRQSHVAKITTKLRRIMGASVIGLCAFTK